MKNSHKILTASFSFVFTTLGCGAQFAPIGHDGDASVPSAGGSPGTDNTGGYVGIAGYGATANLGGTVSVGAGGAVAAAGFGATGNLGGAATVTCPTPVPMVMPNCASGTAEMAYDASGCPLGYVCPNTGCTCAGSVPPGPTTVCTDGSLATEVCAVDATGGCSWAYRNCPQTCEQACGISPTTGQALCSATYDPASYPISCPQLSGTLYPTTIQCFCMIG